MELKTHQTRFFERFHRATRNHICPECGAKMSTVNKNYEGCSVFVWYECPEEKCPGQWLQRYSRDDI